jgi:hypothetical protein
VRKTNGEIIVFIDAHCIVDDFEWIQRLLAYFQNSEVRAVAGYFLKMPRLWEFSHRFRVESQLRIIRSANVAYRKAVFEQVASLTPARNGQETPAYGN